MALSRTEVLKRLREQISSRTAIIGAGAGTGISAKFAEKGGVDLIIIYNSGRFRMAGRGSLAGLLPYGDANAIVVDMASEVLPVVKDTPVLAGPPRDSSWEPARPLSRKNAVASMSSVQLAAYAPMPKRSACRPRALAPCSSARPPSIRARTTAHRFALSNAPSGSSAISCVRVSS